MIKVHQHALINQMLYKKKKLRPNDVLVRPTEKVSRTSATRGKNESRAPILYVCVFILYIINTHSTHTYIKLTKTFILDAINRLTAIM